MEKARRHLIDFSQFTYRGYQQARHLDIIDKELAAVERHETKRLIITVGPRHGKSEKVSIRFPAKHLGNFPDDRLIMSSYAVDLSRKFSKSVRDMMEDEPYKMVFPGVALAVDSKAANQWDLGGKHRGGLKATGVGSGTTGWGANIFLVDDPVADIEQAESKVYREKVWNWYQGVVQTRLEPDASIIIIMTRWHKDDLVGRLLAQQKEGERAGNENIDKWKVLNFVAITETEEDVKNDPLGRGLNEALWPERWPLDVLLRKKHSIGSRKWNALYKGQPVDPENQIVERDWIQYYDVLPPDTLTASGIDTATSKKTSADNFSMVDICRARDGFLYCDDSFLDKMSVSSFAEHVVSSHLAKKRFAIGIEENAAGEAVKQRIEEKGRARHANIPINGFTTSTDKVVRVMEWQPLIENGTIKFKRGNKRVADLIDHIVDFDGTGGTIDDDVDAFGFAVKASAVSAITIDDIDAVGDDRDFYGGEDRDRAEWDDI